MNSINSNQSMPPQGNTWLKPYYYLRAGFSIVWVIAAFAAARNMPAFSAALLLLYPAWDAYANLLDARRNGGLKQNQTQRLNMVISMATTIAVAIALGISMNAVLIVFGIWAILAGVFQLATAMRRWKRFGGQWAMVLSGAQSALAGAIFVKQANGPDTPSIAAIAPYAAFGAFYFLVSALWLTVSDMRRARNA